MTKEEFLFAVDRIGVRRDAYCVGRDQDECYIMTREGGLWAVYYNARGLRSGLSKHHSESDAFDRMFDLLSADPSVRQA